MSTRPSSAFLQEVVWLTFLGAWGLLLWLVWGQSKETEGWVAQRAPEKPIAGYLMARVEPAQAQVWVGGKAWAWDKGGMALMPGRYEIRAQAEGYERMVKHVRVHAEDATVVRLLLEPLPVAISIDSLPSGARVVLNQRDIGTTPIKAMLKPRMYRLRLSSPSLVTVEQDIAIRAAAKQLQRWIIPLGGASKVAVDGGTRRWIPRGGFLRGLSDQKIKQVNALCQQYRKDCHVSWWSDEQPERWIEAGGFWMDQVEVTQARYKRCVAAGACSEPRYLREASNLPVLGVSWSQSVAYCRWAGGRLPSEAEWEMAARGADGRLFVWGEEWKQGAANHGVFLPERQTSGPFSGDGAHFEAVVGRYPQDRSIYGIFDLAGNLREWVADCYHASYFRVAPEKNPFHQAEACLMRVIRGGAWSSPPWDLRVTARQPAPPNTQSLAVGFRCAEDAPLEKSVPSAYP